MKIETPVEFLERIDVYCEKCVGNKWCYKFQPKGMPIIIVTHEEKETAAIKMIKELQSTYLNKEYPYISSF